MLKINSSGLPIAITQGDSAGIGPETIVQAFRDAPELLRGCFVVGEVATLRRAAASVLRPGEPLVPLAVLDHPAQAWEVPPRCVPLWPVPDLPGPQPWGQVSALAGQAAGQCVQWAARAALRGEVAALVTAPLHKEALAAAGFSYPGHTELLQAEAAQHAGVPLAQMPMWNPRKPLGGSSADELDGARVILWHGFCSVHRRFTVDQIDKARAEHPDVRVIVHPECPMAVVDAADEAGSTDYIRKAIAAASEPTTFAIGTEINLVQRLAAQFPQHEIFCLDPVVCPCSTMYRIHPGYLAWVLERLVAGEVVNRITVPADVADPARVALERMLAAKP